MSPFTTFIFRMLLVAGGCILLYIIGKPVVETIQFQINGESVQGIVIGFKGSKNSTTVFEDNTAKYRTKYRARRPVYRYPIKSGSLDSLDGYAKSTIIFPWLNFERHERVKVVMDAKDPSRSHIFSPGIFFTDFLLIMLCLYMIKLGFARSRS
jgi:hypothetical protein